MLPADLRAGAVLASVTAALDLEPLAAQEAAISAIVQPLKLQLKRPAAADLRRLRAALGFTVTAPEAASGRFGASTRTKAVAATDARTARHVSRA